jgi:uncharacterized protein
MIVSLQRPAWFAMLVVLFWGLVGAVHAAAPLPASPTPYYIRDDAKWLSPSGFDALNAKLMAFEKETSSQFVVAVFPRIPEGEELFDFSQKIYESWKPGIAGKDNGAILLIFADDRKLRIHTGRGMEGVLPDARCKQIISDIISPKLREGSREAAINAGIDAMIAVTNGEYQGTGGTQLGKEEEDPFGKILFAIIGLVILYRIFASFTGASNLGDVIFTVLGVSHSGGSSNWGEGNGGGGGDSGGFSGGGGDSGGGGASGDW